MSDAPAARTDNQNTAGTDTTTDAGARAAGRACVGSDWLLTVLAGLTVLLGVFAALAPVEADDPVITWPRAGQAPTSTVVPLSPYRPLSLTATVPCDTVRAVDSLGPADNRVLATQDSDDQGMRIAAGNGTVTFAVSGEKLLSERVRQDPCTYRVLADADGVRIELDGSVLAQRGGMYPPQVAELSTQAEGLPEARGLAVEMHTDARYQSSPSVLKVALLIAHGLALVLLLVLAWRRWRGGPPMRVLSWPRGSLADIAVVLVAGAWVFLGPLQMDDSWYLLMARNSAESGYVGNYVYMFNTTENPFVLSQYLMQLWGELGGWSVWWIRIVPILCGLVTWGILRVTLATMLGRAATLRVVPWALLVAFLVWFLPYGASLRPEPVIVTCSAATLLFAEAARLRRSIGALAVAVLFAALAVTVSPSGVVAAAPLVLALSWVTPWLRRNGWVARTAAVAVVAAAGTVIVPVGFADASLGDVLDTTFTHQWYYLSHPWYEEIVHYNTLLNTSGWGRRLPVLLTLALLLVFGIAHGRAGGSDAVRRLVLTSGITSAVAIGLIALSPTKWVNHFHAIAAAPIVLLAAALVRSPLPRRAGPVVRIVAVLITVGAVSLSFAGKNLWHPFTDAGQRFGNHLDTNPLTNDVEPHFGPLYLSNPLLWIGVAVLAWAFAKYRRHKGKLIRIQGERSVLVAACVGAVILLLALFAYAPVSMYPSWTLASSGVRAVAGDGCGIASDVKVLLPAEQRLGPAGGPPRLDGDFVAGLPESVHAQPWNDGSAIWHDDLPDGTTTGTGSLTTGWYPLPSEGGTHITVPVAGRLSGQQLRIQFGSGNPLSPNKVSTTDIEPDPRHGTVVWQHLQVPLPADRPASVRVTVSDVVTGQDTWLALAEPKLSEFRSVNDVTKDQVVFADQISAAVWPCVNQATIANGISDTPSVWLTADEAIPMIVLSNSTFLRWGGAWVQLSRTWGMVKLHSELRPEGPERPTWGQVFQVRYPYPTGQFDLRVDTVTRGGLTRLPSIADNRYPNIPRNDGLRP